MIKPKVPYKLHPKALEIAEDKLKRRKMLEEAEQKEKRELQTLKQQKKEYTESNKASIAQKKSQLYNKKLQSTNKIKQEQLNRYQRIEEKKLEILSRYVPERQKLIQELRRQYKAETLKREQKKVQLRDEENEKMNKILKQLLNPKQVEFGYKSTNDGVCVICLTQKAQLMMIECDHLISCKGCEFVLRMNKRCPLCREASSYKSIFAQKGKTRIGKSVSKHKKL